MSLMAMVFLPSTFLTGLFGVNLGGIPGGEYHYGFTTFLRHVSGFDWRCCVVVAS
ncbi:Zinc transport protein ZntB [Enterobacter hormaechei]|nr:Zinc transport protein ZntB [Enterobacter hormaechei]